MVDLPTLKTSKSNAQGILSQRNKMRKKVIKMTIQSKDKMEFSKSPKQTGNKTAVNFVSKNPSTLTTFRDNEKLIKVERTNLNLLQ